MCAYNFRLLTSKNSTHIDSEKIYIERIDFCIKLKTFLLQKFYEIQYEFYLSLEQKSSQLNFV